MIRPLVAKEVRDQRPFLWLALFFIALDVLTDSVVQAPGVPRPTRTPSSRGSIRMATCP